MRGVNSAAITGFLLCFAAIVFGIATNGGLGSILFLVHLPSFVLTVGGAICAVLMTADSMGDFMEGLASFALAFRRPDSRPERLSEDILALADLARREGLLALEERAREVDNDFLRKGVMLIVDGTEAELVKDMLDSELSHKQDRDRLHINFWRDLGGYGPAWGMIGTLLGLINMMRAMGEDASSVGEGMSLALITTLYGSILANWICIPISRKLEKSSAQEVLNMEICIEGVLSIQAGENPRIIQEKLNSVIELKQEQAA